MQVSVYQHTYATFCGVWLNFSILLQKSQWVRINSAPLQHLRRSHKP